MIGVESPPNAARLILMTIRQLEIEALLKPKGIMTFGNEAITHVSSPRYLSVLKGFVMTAVAPTLTTEQQEILSRVQLHESWKTALAPVFLKPYMAKLRQFLAEEKKLGKTIYPPAPDYFNAFNTTPLSQVKVVILGKTRITVSVKHTVYVFRCVEVLLCRRHYIIFIVN